MLDGLKRGQDEINPLDNDPRKKVKRQEEGSSKTYYLNVAKQYKIWFSTDKDSFLGMDDQLRFIRTRLNNPQAKLSFLYSSHCLSPTAINALKAFCAKYRITPVDFDTEIMPLLK